MCEFSVLCSYLIDVKQRVIKHCFINSNIIRLNSFGTVLSHVSALSESWGVQSLYEKFVSQNNSLFFLSPVGRMGCQLSQHFMYISSCHFWPCHNPERSTVKATHCAVNEMRWFLLRGGCVVCLLLCASDLLMIELVARDGKLLQKNDDSSRSEGEDGSS